MIQTAINRIEVDATLVATSVPVSRYEDVADLIAAYPGTIPVWIKLEDGRYKLKLYEVDPDPDDKEHDDGKDSGRTGSTDCGVGGNEERKSRIILP